MRPSWNMAHHLQMQQQLQTQRQVVKYTVLQLDKATQTDGVYDDGGGVDLDTIAACEAIEATEFRIGRVMRDRLHGHRGATGGASGGGSTTTEHSVSSQTLSPVHGEFDDANLFFAMAMAMNCHLFHTFIAKASPMSIPPRPYPAYAKPMRNSVEGLNQEIEKLVLVTTCGRPESNLVRYLNDKFLNKKHY